MTDPEGNEFDINLRVLEQLHRGAVARRAQRVAIMQNGRLSVRQPPGEPGLESTMRRPPNVR